MSAPTDDLVREAFPAVQSLPFSSAIVDPPQGNGTTPYATSPVARLQVLSAAKVLAGQSRSLSGVALRAFILGQCFGINLFLAAYFVYHQHLVWRIYFFLATLALFHFLEYYMTAAYNTQYADIGAYLLSQNGKAYNIAHTAAVVECVIRIWLFPQWQLTSPAIIMIGFVAIISGQVIRSIAMAHAGTNFNHTVQTQRLKGHELVTEGIYHWLRHPAYFGFFWWGLGTQVVLGNPICLLAYAMVLWRFFSHRIRKEEEFLVAFFGEEYATYRDNTTVLIPFIR